MSAGGKDSEKTIAGMFLSEVHGDDAGTLAILKNLAQAARTSTDSKVDDIIKGFDLNFNDGMSPVGSAMQRSRVPDRMGSRQESAVATRAPETVEAAAPSESTKVVSDFKNMMDTADSENNNALVADAYNAQGKLEPTESKAAKAEPNAEGTDFDLFQLG